MRLIKLDRWIGISAVIYTALGCILWMIPLLNVLHAESSAVIAGVSFFVAGLSALTQLNSRQGFQRVLFTQLLLLLIPWGLLTISLLWQHNCSYGQGVLFFLLFPPFSVILAVAVAFLIYNAGIKSKKTVFISLGLFLGIGGVVYDLGFHSQFFTYSHVFGGILGPIYDEELTIRGGLLAFRGRTLLMAWFCWALGEGLRKGLTFRLQWGLLLAPVCLVLSFLFAAPLRINTPAAFIKEHLKGHISTEHFDIYYDDASLDSTVIEQLVDEHEYRYQFIHRQLGIDVAQRIQSFIYPDAETKDWLTGSRNTSVAPVWLREPQMHILIDVFDRVFPHELGHVFSREFGLPVIHASLSVGLVEGLAVSLEPADGRPSPHEQVLTAVALSTPPGGALAFEQTIGLADRLSPLGFWTGRGAVSYTTMGSFVQFLAEKYGYERVMDAYAGSNFESVFGKSIDELVAEWETRLSAIPQIDRSTHAYVTRRFSVPSLFEKRCPHHLPAYERNFRNGISALVKEDTLGALNFLEMSIAEAPAFEDAINAWAAIKISQHEEAPVISRIRSIFVDPAEKQRASSTAGIWVQLGDALALAGQPVDAMAAFDSALVRLPLYAHQQRGLVLLRIALAGEAEVQYIIRSPQSALEKVKALDTLQIDNPDIQLLQAVLLTVKEAHEPALIYLKKFQGNTETGEVKPDIEHLVSILSIHLNYRTGELQTAMEEARALARQFSAHGALNSANQYTDFADKMSYIVQRKAQGR